MVVPAVQGYVYRNATDTAVSGGERLAEGSEECVYDFLTMDNGVGASDISGVDGICILTFSTGWTLKSAVD